MSIDNKENAAVEEIAKNLEKTKVDGSLPAVEDDDEPNKGSFLNHQSQLVRFFCN